jgi:hypothetical protein
MTRSEFEALLQAPGKRFAGPVILRPDPHQPYRLVGDGLIQADDGSEAMVHISHNTMTGSKTINVAVCGVGPVCRLDVDGPVHKNAGRSHKHELQSSGCPRLNLPQASARTDLSGSSIEDLFRAFCSEAGIRSRGFSLQSGARP